MRGLFFVIVGVGLFLSELLFRVVFYVAANPVYISPWRPSCSSRYPSSIPWCPFCVSCNPFRDAHLGRHWHLYTVAGGWQMGKMDGLEIRKEVVCVKKQYYSERLVQKKSPPLKDDGRT